MGSGSSSQPPSETQSAPPTTRNSPNKPKRNKHFEEVQLAPGGERGSRKGRTPRSQGASPHPGQSTSQGGQDPGASGADKRQQQQQQRTPRQGAAANGRAGKTKSQSKTQHIAKEESQLSQAPTSNMPSQQPVQYGSFEELLEQISNKKKPDIQTEKQSEEKDQSSSGNHGNSTAAGNPRGQEDPMVNTVAWQQNNQDPVSQGHATQNHGNTSVISRTEGPKSDSLKNVSKKPKVIIVEQTKAPGTLKLSAPKQPARERNESLNVSDGTNTSAAVEAKNFKNNALSRNANDKKANLNTSKSETTDAKGTTNSTKPHPKTVSFSDKGPVSSKSGLVKNDSRTDELKSQMKPGTSGTVMNSDLNTKADKTNSDEVKKENKFQETAIDVSDMKDVSKNKRQANDKRTSTENKVDFEKKDTKTNAKGYLATKDDNDKTEKSTVTKQVEKVSKQHVTENNKEHGLIYGMKGHDRKIPHVNNIGDDGDSFEYDPEFNDEEHSHDFYDTSGDHDDDMHDDDGEHSEVGAQHHDERDADVLSMKDDDLVFETFYHRSGKEFQCIYQSGMRFYLDDWGSKEWQPFPKRWYNEGLLVTNTILKDDSQSASNNDQQAGASGQGQSSRSQGRSQGQGSSQGGGDDREGFLNHPSKGKLPTYIFYKKHNVHMYFDSDTGSWVRMPIGYELHHNMVKSLVEQVEEAVPHWKDKHDILALLRACNYDPDECISIYLHLERDEWMKAPHTAKEAKMMGDKDNKILDLEEKVRNLEVELQKERSRREELERNLEEQTNTLSELEVESKQTEAQLVAMTGGRPMTARPISVMMKGGKGGKQPKGGKKAGELVNPEDLMDLNQNAMELRKAHTKLKVEVERNMGDLKHNLFKILPLMKQLKQSEKGTQSEIEEVRALYRKEALQRKLLYNQLQELRGNIRVFCRVRKDDRGEQYLKFPSDGDLMAVHPQQGKRMFSFDKVFDPSSTQEQVFEDTKPIITSCTDGYNVCLLAYGQTGSGKTFTMMGPDNNPGINIRAMKELFQVCKDREETMGYTLTVSLVEIYNEHIQDLLSNDAKTLELRTAGNKVNIPGLTVVPIRDLNDVKKVMTMGDQNRHVASTKMNSTSSRSHLVLMLACEGHDKVTKAVSRGTLTLCDLAGSERIAKTEAEGQRLVEAAAINKSLSALGQVFSSLRSSQLHVPYRNSKLTQILQPSLGGDAKACLFVNVSPDMYNYAETVSTLTFGSNARQVALGQAKQNITKGNR